MKANKNQAAGSKKPAAIIHFKTQRTMKTGFKTIDNLPAKHLAKVDEVSDERSGGDGFWIYLAKGYCMQIEGSHIIHEDTVSHSVKRLKTDVFECQCDECK